MAIQSVGYIGSILPNVAWARVHAWGAGHRYWCYDQGAVKVTAVSAGTRQVSIAAGYFGGWGILDYNDANATVSLPTVASGTRYFMITAKRTWGSDAASSATTFAYVDAGTVANVLPTRATNYGTLDEQPLALVSLAAGSAVPVVIADLRAIGTEGGLVILSTLSLNYLAFVGARVRLGNDTYTRVLNAAGTTASWSKNPGPYGRVALTSTALVGASGAGWGASGLGSRWLAHGNEIQVDLLTRRSGAALAITSTGGIDGGDNTVIKFTNVPLPTQRVPVALSYYQSGSTVMGLGMLYPNGDFKLISGTPGTSVTTVPASGTQFSIVACIKYTVESAS